MINSIREKVIKAFIKENYRSPTQQEIKNLYNEYLVKAPQAEEVGILSSESNIYPIAGDESSSKV